MKNIKVEGVTEAIAHNRHIPVIKKLPEAGNVILGFYSSVFFFNVPHYTFYQLLSKYRPLKLSLKRSISILPYFGKLFFLSLSYSQRARCFKSDSQEH